MKKNFLLLLLLITSLLYISGCDFSSNPVPPTITENSGFSKVYEVDSPEPDWSLAITATDKQDGDIAIKEDYIDTSNVDMSNVGTFDVIYDVVNSKELSSTKTITISIVDTTKPVLIGEDTFTYEVDSNEPDWLSLVSVTDNYDGDITLTLSNIDLSNVDMNTVGTFNVIYTVTDSQNNTNTKTITVNIVDTTKPVLIGEDTFTYEVDSNEPDWLSLISVTDNYDGDITLTLSNIDLSNVDMNTVGTFNVIYTVTDSQNNTNTKTITVNIVDTTKPVLIGEDTFTYEVDSNDPDWLSLISVTDNYDDDITLTLSNIDLSNVDMNTVGTFNVIYTVTDSQNNTNTKTITVNIVDTTKPVLIGEDTFTYEVDSNEPDWLSLVSVTDNYDSDITLTLSNIDLSNVDMNTVGTFNVIYTVTDSQNNTNTKTITVNIVDTTKPVLIGEDTFTYEVDSNEPDWLTLISVTDNYDGDITLTLSNIDLTNVDMNTVGTFNVIYTVTDSQNNTNTKTITVNIVDTTKPVLIGEDTFTYEVDSNEPDWLSLISVTDNYDGDITLTLSNVDLSNVDMNTVGTFNVVYTVTDSQNNTNTKTITVNIVDTTKPVLIGEDTFTYEVDSNEPDWLSLISVTDNYDGDITLTLSNIDLSNVDMNTVGTFNVIYTVTDSQNNTNTKTITVNIVDTTKPVLIGEDTFTYEVDSNEPDWLSLVSVTDNYDGDITLTLSNIDLSNVDMNTVGTFNVIYTVTDSQNNTNTKTITVNIVDTTKPVLIGEDTFTYEVDSNEPDWLSLISVTDNYDGDITLTLSNVDLSNVDMNTVGSFDVTYTVVDMNGNIATHVMTIHIVDTTAPVLTGDDTLTYEVGTIFPDWVNLVVATDNYDGEIDLTIDQINLSNLNINVLGDYEVIYTVSDMNGNTTIKTISVTIVDTEAPVITGEEKLTFGVGTEEPDWLTLIEVADNYDGAMIISLTDVDLSQVDMDAVGLFNVLYTVTDTSGNTTIKTISVTIVDTEAPVITGEELLTFEVGTEEPDWLTIVNVIDNYDGNMTLTTANVDLSQVDMNTVGSFTVTYRVSDSSNNTTTKIITIFIVDTTPPVITLNGESDMTILLGTEYVELGATAYDNYDGDLSSYILIDASIDTNVEDDYVITYYLIDSNHNIMTIDRTIHVINDMSFLITDENLLHGIQDYLGNGPITIEDAASIRELSLENYQISSLSGIENLINLTALDLYGNQITDISPLLHLENLEWVLLINNPIEITPDSANEEVVFKFMENNVICDLIGQYIDDDYGDTPTNAASIDINTTISGIIDYTLDSDYFVFTINEAKTIYIHSNNSNGFLLLYNDALEEFTELNINYFGELQPGTYYIRLLGIVIDQPVNYELTIDEFIDSEIVFNDTNLENSLRDVTGIYNRQLLKSDLLGITQLNLEEQNISDLTGIENCINLNDLNLIGNNITDIKPLLGLNSLFSVYLTNNPIDLTVDSDNYNVIQYFINNQIISDINGLLIDDDYSDLASDATVIDLNSTISGEINYPYDKDFMTFTLLQDTEINFTLLNTKDIFMITIYNQDLIEINHIDSDTSTINMTLNAGTYYIEVSGGTSYQFDFSEYIPLSNEILFTDNNFELAVREYLDIYDRPILIEDVELVTELHLNGYNISDLTGIEYFSNLQQLDLSDNHISDLTPLANLTNLNVLRLYHNEITDITPLANLTQLVSLDLGDNQITQVDVLVNLVNLVEISISMNPITDITPVSYLSNLSLLYMYDMGISDLSPIANLTNLNSLMLNDNEITDLTPLMNLNNLQELYLGNNPINLTVDSNNYNILFNFYNQNITCDLFGIFIPDDYSDTPENATEITIGSDITGHMDYPFDKDYFVFTLSDATSY